MGADFAKIRLGDCPRVPAYGQVPEIIGHCPLPSAHDAANGTEPAAAVRLGASPVDLVSAAGSNPATAASYDLQITAYSPPLSGQGGEQGGSLWATGN